ncbi:MAG: glycerol-3-phosphate acyltransferase [candidate division WOR-3 bacterium]|nr:MAG: glycerol-3-phosphate acyltransferase [candidate division WOR-3 bacterium]
MVLRTIALTLAGFLSGSLMFSAWLVRLRGKDIREFGDGNPGAVNAFKACGPGIGIPALVLDFLKGAVPVWLASHAFGVEGFWLVPVALAPVLGHAFSPFTRFRGGKAVTATFGVWAGLTLWEGPTVLGLLLALGRLVQKTDVWTLVFGMLGLLAWWLARGARPELPVVLVGVLTVLLWKHRHELRTLPRFRRWLGGKEKSG